MSVCLDTVWHQRVRHTVADLVAIILDVHVSNLAIHAEDGCQCLFLFLRLHGSEMF